MDTQSLYGTHSEQYATMYGPVTISVEGDQVVWRAHIGGQDHTGSLPIEHSLENTLQRARVLVDATMPTLSHLPTVQPAADRRVADGEGFSTFQ